jgi:hypothetical protein
LEVLGVDLFGVVGMLAGIGGCLVGGLGLHQSKLSREVAEEANQAARESAAAAQRANEIADEANALSARAVSAVTERHFVEWKPTWDERACELRLYNRGGDDAHEVRLTVLADEAHTIQAFEGAIHPGAWIGVHLPEVDQKREEHKVQTREKQARFADRGYSLGSTKFSIDLHVTITWRSDAQLPKADTFDYRVT